MNMDRNTVSRSHDRGVYAATALASAKDEVRESPRGKATLPQFDSNQEPGANDARPRSEREGRH